MYCFYGSCILTLSLKQNHETATTAFDHLPLPLITRNTCAHFSACNYYTCRLYRLCFHYQNNIAIGKRSTATHWSQNEFATETAIENFTIEVKEKPASRRKQNIKRYNFHHCINNRHSWPGTFIFSTDCRVLIDNNGHHYRHYWTE